MRGVTWRPADGGPAESVRVPTSTERGKLAERHAALAVAARGAGGTDAEMRKLGQAVAEILDGFLRSRSISTAEKQVIIAGYVKDLSPLPAWAVARACERVRKGAVAELNLAFAPTSPQLYQLAMNEIEPLRDEQRAIAGVLALVQCRPPENIKPMAPPAGPVVTWAEMQRAQDEQRAKAVLDRVEAQKRERLALIAAQWPGEPPTIAGVPVSRELAEQMGVTRENDIDRQDRAQV